MRNFINPLILNYLCINFEFRGLILLNYWLGASSRENSNFFSVSKIVDPERSRKVLQLSSIGAIGNHYEVNSIFEQFFFTY